MDIFYVTT